VRTLNTRALACGAGLLLSGTFLSTAASAQGSSQICPTFPGTNITNPSPTGCSAVITITSTGATLAPTGQGPYDGSDDTLIGIVNMIPKCTSTTGTNQTVCGLSIYSLDLTSTFTIFAFDGDGIDDYGAPGNAMDSSGYGGPYGYFRNINGALTSGRVNFTVPIPPAGGNTYFSLENKLSGSTACTNAINASICGRTAGGTTAATNCGGSTPNVPSVLPNATNGRSSIIRAAFVPQGIDPNTKQKYTLANAAAVCGFANFNWQQTITKFPAPLKVYAVANPTVPLMASFNDPPLSGYTYQASDPTLGNIANNVQIPVYFNLFQPNTYPLSLAANTTGTNQINFFDAPQLPGLPAGQTVNFTTHLVGIVGPTPLNATTASVVDTGMGFNWTSNYTVAAGGILVVNGTDGEPVQDGTGIVTITSVSQASTYTGVGITAINGSSNIFGPTSLLTAALPESRSVQVNGTATAFATIINTGANTATGCSIAPASSLPLTFVYQTTNPATNAVTGTPNTPVNIAAGASQTFVIALTPTAAIVPTDVGFNFNCTNTTPAPIVTGLSTLLFSASTTPTSDIVALAATTTNDGIVHIPGAPGTGAFAVATVNLGAGGSITAAANTGDASLPLTITMCQTNPKTGQCLQTPSPKVATTINAGTTPTFAVFVAASGTVPFDPANSRVFVQFTDSTNAVRGETSVAVTTQ
jgi:hypothetical protein